MTFLLGYGSLPEKFNGQHAMEITWKEKGKGQMKSSQDGAWDKKIRVKFQCTSAYDILMVACFHKKK